MILHYSCPLFLAILTVLSGVFSRPKGPPPLNDPAGTGTGIEDPLDLMQELKYKILEDLGFRRVPTNLSATSISHDQFLRAYTQYMMNVRERRIGQSWWAQNGHKQRRRGSQVRLHAFLPTNTQTTTSTTSRTTGAPNWNSFVDNLTFPLTGDLVADEGTFVKKATVWLPTTCQPLSLNASSSTGQDSRHFNNEENEVEEGKEEEEDEDGGDEDGEEEETGAAGGAAGAVKGGDEAHQPLLMPVDVTRSVIRWLQKEENKLNRVKEVGEGEEEREFWSLPVTCNSGPARRVQEGQGSLQRSGGRGMKAGGFSDVQQGFPLTVSAGGGGARGVGGGAGGVLQMEGGRLEVVTVKKPGVGGRVRRDVHGGGGGKKLRVSDFADGETEAKERRLGKRRAKDCADLKHGKSCCRKKLQVSFEELKITEVILAPSNFDMDYCEGRCSARRLPYASNHAIFQHMIMKKGRGAKLCCSPTKLTEVDVIQRDPLRHDQLKVTVIHNAKVVECGCS